MIYYAPVLPAEGWTSIDRYRQDYEQFMPRHFPDIKMQSLLPDTSLEMNPWKRRYLRDVAYPLMLRSTKKNTANDPLHIFDHSYSHLIQHWKHTILHCRDLNHIVQPSLTGLALLRWKQRLSNMKRASKVIAISHQLSEEIQEHVGISKERIEVIHHGVDLDCYAPGRQEEASKHFPALARLAEKYFIVLNIGTNLPRKNLETLYRALKIIQSQNIPVKLVRVGTNASCEGEEERIYKMGLQDEIIQMGLLNSEEVALACNLCHALSFASLYEGFGRPLLEAQACGLPLVAANNSCIPEIAGEGALYHEPKSAENLANQLMRVYEKQPEVEVARKRGLENVKRFSWEKHLQELVSLYAQF